MSTPPNPYLRHVVALNSWHVENFKPFYIANHPVGYVKDYLCQALAEWPQYFSITSNRVDLKIETYDFQRVSEVLDSVVHSLVDQGVIKNYLGELYPVTGINREQRIALLDRGAAGYFGIRTYGQHLNGYVRTETGIKLWIARRSADRINAPNKLDNMVAGGLPYNLSFSENLLKECKEEAGLPQALVNRAIATGAINYCCEVKTGLKPDTLYCYDLELPESFTPRNTDGEVAEFRLMDVQTVVELVRDSDEFKTNCNLVLLDFFIRHGVIGPECEGYLELIESLHVSIA